MSFMRFHYALAILIGSIVAQVRASDEEFLSFSKEARYMEGIEHFEQLISTPDNKNSVLFRLAMMQFLASVDNLGRKFYRYGMGPQGQMTRSFSSSLPFARLPVPANPNLEEISVDELRAIFAAFGDELAGARETLNLMDNQPFKVIIPLEEVRFDFSGGGDAAQMASALQVFQIINRNARWNQEQNPKLEVAFDRGDADWLRGYTHLLGLCADFIQGYEIETIFENTAHSFFALPQTEASTYLHPYTNQQRWSWDEAADFVAFIHLIKLPVRDEAKIQQIRSHLLEVIASSRKSHEFWNQEIDNDREWIPNPKQQCVFTSWTISEVQQTQWLAFLSELELILNGKRLAPYWRGDSGKGVNVMRALMEPGEFDLILWIQGSAAIPYLEDGEQTDQRFWNQLWRGFGGQFPGFALWLN